MTAYNTPQQYPEPVYSQVQEVQQETPHLYDIVTDQAAEQQRNRDLTAEMRRQAEQTNQRR